MDKYKKITDLGLQVFTKPLHQDIELVAAEDLLDVLNQGVRVFCRQGQISFSQYKTSEDTHTGLVIGIKELKPKSLEERILEEMSKSHLSSTQVLENIRSIVTNGV